MHTIYLNLTKNSKCCFFRHISLSISKTKYIDMLILKLTKETLLSMFSLLAVEADYPVSKLRTSAWYNRVGFPVIIFSSSGLIDFRLYLKTSTIDFPAPCIFTFRVTYHVESKTTKMNSIIPLK